MAHQMWAHPGKKAIEKLTSNVDGLVIKGDTNDFCAVCTESKLTKQISRRQQEDQAQKPFYRIAVDTDNERGYGTSPNFLEELCRDLGIRYEPRAEYTEEQNRLAERVGSLLVIRARAIRIQKTPYEIVWKTKPKVQHMRPIGCRAYVLNRSLKRGDKLESRALIGHLVGYDSTNIFRIWLPTKDQVIRTRDVVFEPTKFYDGPQGYARESIIEEVIELLSFPEEFELDDIAIEDLLTSRQRRQQQPSHASALPESQMGGEEIEQDKEQYEGGLPTPEPSNLSLHNDQDLISEQQAIDEQDLKTFPRLRSKATYLIDIRTTLQDVETLISARIILLKVHAVHEESLISKNQRDGTLTLSHMEDQLTTI
ncbi:hypothetical protein Ptr86124_003591 [Pyrenophora tritici-repentis]|uniref:Retroviral polymerase SH3-like domain-containing protein n=1 Tax=Pyrenophora tritici-repentis TaxID=45151 RepID=A0A922T1Y9_9PLEO|nr:hypothetical protein Ptr86124_003591 [Pyrenophora tritici-repentis]